MQALSIYTLIRLDEGETDHNNLDSLLVTTVIVGLASISCSGVLATNSTQVVATQFSSIQFNSEHNTRSEVYNPKYEASWRDWILEESARR